MLQHHLLRFVVLYSSTRATGLGSQPLEESKAGCSSETFGIRMETVPSSRAKHRQSQVDATVGEKIEKIKREKKRERKSQSAGRVFAWLQFLA